MRHGLALCIGLAACTPVDPSGEMFVPVEPTARTAAAEAPVAEDVERFDFEAQARDEEAAADDGGEVSLERQMAGLGLAGVEAPPAEEPTLDAAPLTPAQPTRVAAATPEGPWMDINSLTEGFGLRVVATLAHTQPPRAVLALADGEELVVRAGTLVPQADVVVLAIGEDAVQVAEVRTGGDQAAIETRVLPALRR